MTIDAPHDVAWLDSEERAAWMTLIAMLMSVPAAIDAQLKRDSGLNFFEYSILSHLSQRQNHAVQMSNLAHLAGGSLSRLSHAVSRLEKQGYVTRRGGTDGESRCVQASLTQEGFDLLVAAAPAHVGEARRLVFDHLSPVQVRQLQRIAHEIAAAAAPGMVEQIDSAIEAAERAEREGRSDPCVPPGC